MGIVQKNLLRPLDQTSAIEVAHFLKRRLQDSCPLLPYAIQGDDYDLPPALLFGARALSAKWGCAHIAGRMRRLVSIAFDTPDPFAILGVITMLLYTLLYDQNGHTILISEYEIVSHIMQAFWQILANEPSVSDELQDIFCEILFR